MALIPWITEGDNPTVVTDMQCFKRRGKAVLVTNFQREQVDDQNNTNASYDLRVGEHYRSYRDIEIKTLPPGGIIQVPPKTAVVIETEERLHFPETVFGLIVPKESMLRQGIANTPTKVDPGYPEPGSDGKLHITVFNHGTETAKLQRRQPFCALCLFQILEGVRPYNKGPKALSGQPKSPRWPAIREKLEQNQILLTLIVAGVAVAGLLVSIFSNFFRGKPLSP